ncbi:MAG: hypothetical protein ABW171_12430, partial [Steroidobacter sp.]
MTGAVKKGLAWTGIVFAVLILAIVGTLAWVLNTQSGTRWAAARATAVLGDKLAIETIDGSIAGPLRLTNLRYRDPTVGIDVGVRELTLDMVLNDLWRQLVHVKSLEISGIDVLTHEPTEPPPEEPDKPFTLKPPIDIAVDSFLARDVKVRNPEAMLVEVTRATFIGRWTEEALAVKTLDVQSPQGFVKFDGRFSQPKSYLGEGKGQFRWTAGEQTFAGSLEANANESDASVGSKLTSPLDARLDVKIAQASDHRWQLQLDVPRFDPREALMPDSSLQSLEASLQGEGTLEQGMVSGTVTINDEPLQLESVRFTRSEERLTLQSLLRIGATAGELRADADIQFSEESWTSKVKALWKDIVVPPAWAGQELYTHGEIDFDGNPQLYNATGKLTLGPAQRQANIALQVRGTPELVELQQFDVLQKQGRLAATGKVNLQPQIAWTVDARGQDFDPGAFAVEWPGSLRFQLATQGKMTEQGPDATLKLTQLRGKLRGRPISGDADLTITAPFLPGGTLALTSGQSKLSIDAAKGEQIDAKITVDVASLNDWLPNSGGELGANIRVQGKWPDIAINGNARGRELHMDDLRANEFALDADVKKPLDPEGSVKLSITGVAAAGLTFDTVQANASGNSASHRAELTTTGQPLAVSLAMQGKREQ